MLFDLSGTLNVSTTFSVEGVVYFEFMLKHFFGHTSVQCIHCMHCILSIVQVLALLSTVIAFVGHFLAQIPHAMHSDALISTAPLVRSCHSRGITGYMRVAGFLNKRFITNPPILNVPTSLTYLSVQLMQGSIVNTIIGTSARSHPCNILTIAGIFMLVGVLTLILSRNFVPWPLQ